MKSQDTSALSEKLNILLSSYQVAYNNIRSAHWMVKGDKWIWMLSQFLSKKSTI